MAIGGPVTRSNYEYGLAGLVVFVVLIVIAWHFYKIRKLYQLTISERGLFHSYEALDHARAFDEEGLGSERKAAAKSIARLIKMIDFRWQITYKAQAGKIEEIDHLMNRSIDILEGLEKIEPMMFEEKTDDLKRVIKFLDNLVKFFQCKTESSLDEVISSAKYLPEIKQTLPEKKKQEERFFQRHARLTNCLLALPFAISAVLFYFFIKNIASVTDDGRMQDALLIGFSYFGALAVKEKFISK